MTENFATQETIDNQLAKTSLILKLDIKDHSKHKKYKTDG